MAIQRNHTRAPRRIVRRRAFTFALAAVGQCLVAARAHAATVSLSVSPAAAELGEGVTLKVSVIGSGGGTPRVTLPKGVRTVGKPSHYSMMRRVGNRTTTSTDFTYTLQIDAAGTYVIGPATVRIGRRDVRSGTARLVVKKAGTRKDVRVFASIEPARAYAGQLVVATFEFAVARGRKINGYSLAIPFLAGIKGAEVFDPENLLEQIKTRTSAGLQLLQVGQPRSQAVAKISTRDIDGMPYEVYTVRRMVLPSTPGLYDIGRASMVASVVTGRRRVRGFFGVEDRPVTKRIALTSDPLTLEVLAPPIEGRPPGYSGAIGMYKLTAEASPTEVALGGEPVALTLTVRGEGNIETVPQPKLAGDSGWRVGSVEQQQQTGFEAGRPFGEKRFTIPLRPRSAEVVAVPAAELAVFDPLTESYVTLRTEPIPVRVTVPDDSGALEGVALPEAARAKMREREEVKQDIEDIETQVDASASDAAWLHGGGGLVAFFALPLAAFAAASVVARRRRELRENTALARRLAAAKAARAAFAGLHGDGGAEGEEGAASLPGPEFAEAVAKALQGYLADRLDRPGGEIPPDEAERLLNESGVDKGLASDAAGVLREAGAARFGGGGVEPEELLARAETCVDAIEKGGAS